MCEDIEPQIQENQDSQEVFQKKQFETTPKPEKDLWVSSQIRHRYFQFGDISNNEEKPT